MILKTLLIMPLTCDNDNKKSLREISHTETLLIFIREL
jgi:hypothetical protein